MAHIAIISGSPSKHSRLAGVLQLVKASLESDGWNVHWVNVRELPPEDLLHARFDSPAIEEARRGIEQAEGVIVATPVYKASYTGLLKAFLDLLPQKGLAHKRILPIAIGGTIAHLLAIDYALKPVLAALGATTIDSGVYLVDSHVQAGEDGTVQLDGESRDRLEDALRLFQNNIAPTR
ncbi:NADPH-dependent FMN reductase [Brevibacillus sp. SYP-B805]|uniref:NADPH-dependent FMN reductase n=1 Tax=Brevibacillus sp. SYP-B805 TaxID=1578199 RepID=UPI0013EC7C1F|nr:NADPH-dependent FMN reductase [Brevibacillus sp. SYP-B805]NGQ96741.1 NADPH-dependent FMN reductase [Brevibacillus sp. SYP-B805]